MTRNATLVRFLESNDNLCRCIMKMVKLIVNTAEEKRLDASSLNYSVFSPKGEEKIIVIRILGPGEN